MLHADRSSFGMFEGSVELPPRGKRINLNALKIPNMSVYRHVFEFLQKLWGTEVNLVSKTGNWRAGEPFVATAVQSYSHVIVNGTKFGACTSHQGKGNSFAFIDGRIAVRIRYLLSVKHDRRDTSLPSLSTTFAIVEHFNNDGIPQMPWENK